MTFCLADITKDLIGKKWELGKMDCLKLIYDFLDKCGVEPPKNYSGLNLDTYKDFYLRNKEYALKLMIAYFDSFLKPIDINNARSGDIVILQYQYSHKFTGIISGNGKVIISTLDNVKLVSLGPYNILKAYTWQD